MTEMLPPLGTLRPFEAASRLGSLSRAARELGVTQPAISRQIDGLEAWLGMPLFERSPRGLRLTASGALFRDAVVAAFSCLGDATSRLCPADGERTITIAAHPGFAQLWLAPRLARLQASLPALFFRLAATDREDEFDAGGHDLAIRFGTGHWPGWSTRDLLPERIVPVCAPAYLATRPHLARPDRSVSDLAAERLLHMDEISRRWLTWPAWFEACGAAVAIARPKLIHASYPLLLQAALAGEGVALGWLGLVDDHLAAGRLVPLAPVFERPGHGYFLCWRASPAVPAAKRRLIGQVRDWFLAAR
jgi:DNA-binding transcriptional LysR family regulator